MTHRATNLVLTTLIPILLSACGAPVYRIPGPTAMLGQNRPEPRSAVAERRLPSEPRVVEPSIDGLASSRALRSNLAAGERVAQAAVSFEGDKRFVVHGDKFRSDCSGLVSAVYARAGIALDGSGADFLEQADRMGVLHHEKVPSMGDVVFFDNTWDRNGNHLSDDATTHVAVVVGIDPDGTVQMIHWSSAGAHYLSMNLERPDDRLNEAGKLLNDNLRLPLRSDPAGQRYLAGQLWSGFASFWQILENRS